MLLQQIDEMLAGALTQEDEDAVLAELEAITQVGVKLLHVQPLLIKRTFAEHARFFPLSNIPLHVYRQTFMVDL